MADKKKIEVTILNDGSSNSQDGRFEIKCPRGTLGPNSVSIIGNTNGISFEPNEDQRLKVAFILNAAYKALIGPPSKPVFSFAAYFNRESMLKHSEELGFSQLTDGQLRAFSEKMRFVVR